MGPADSRRITRVPRYSGVRMHTSDLPVRSSHPLRPGFPARSRSEMRAMLRSYNPGTAQKRHRFGLFPGRSPLLGESFLFSLPAGTKMFQFPAFASTDKKKQRIAVLQTAGLSHSEIRVSRVICTSARLFAAYHVLHRLHEPRHPPYALVLFCR